MGDLKARIAKRAAQEFHDGDVVNLGIGLPTMCTSFLPEGVDIILQSENGFTGLSGKAEPGKEDYRVIDSGGNWVTYAPYANFFGSEESFSIIRGGHVDQDGNLANWIIPGKAVAGMGGAMDLVCGAKEVIIAMMHTQKGNHKIMKKCTLPLTAEKVVDKIITEMGVMEWVDGKLTLTEIYDDYTIDQIKEATEAEFAVAENLKHLAAE